MCPDRIVFNTNPNVNTVVRTPSAFDAAAFAAPGMWNFANAPV